MGFNATNHSNIEVESVLRIRPLQKKEKEDSIVLEQNKSVIRNGPSTVVLHPLHSSLVSPNSSRSRGESSNSPSSFHFNHVLDENTSQDKIYYTLGLPLATAAMSSLKSDHTSRARSPRNHLLLCVGVVNSGKTYTCFGGNSIPKRRASQDGLIPRLVDSLFSQSKHHASNGSQGFALQISVVQVTHSKGSDPHACQIHDLLAAPTKSGSPKKSPVKRNLTVRSMAARFEQALPTPILSPLKSTEFAEVDVDDPSPTIENCHDVSQAREVLQKGLNSSKKASKGRNYHLLVTMQPVLNGSQFGDKISILDMAGLDRDKRGPGRKDGVANKNQAANSAVLHCLRTLIHNTNIRNGKSSPMDIHCVDDAASEISCVSQEKGVIHDREKPVPFRQHKVSMLLRPLFESARTTKVIILMAAYPGHADYQEKRLLLQDMELLHGASLLAAPSTAATGFESQSVLSSESKSCMSSEYDAESVGNRPGHSKRTATARKFEESRLKSPRNVPSSSVSIDSDLNHKRHPPPYAPSFREAAPLNPSAPPAETEEPYHVAPSAPSAPPLEEWTDNGNRNHHHAVSDFPGVTIPSKGDQKDRRIVASETTGGRKAQAPPFYEEEYNSKPKKYNVPSPTSKGKDLRAPLGRSSLENGCPAKEVKQNHGRSKGLQEAKIIQRTGHRNAHTKKQNGPSSANDRAWTKESKDRCENPLDNSHLRVRVDRAYAKSGCKSQDSPNEQIRKMSAQIQEILAQKHALEHRCNELESENKKLKIDVREAGRSKRQAQWTSQDQEEFLESRRVRREDQNLVKAPLMSHMQRVNYIYDIKNQCFITNKPHFDLSFPQHFQRAPQLDIRDKKNDELERQQAEESNTLEHQDSDMPAAKLNYDAENSKRASSKPSAASSTRREKRARNNSGIAALKQLAMSKGR